MSPSLLRFRQAQVLASAVVLGLGAWSAAGIARHYQKVRPVLAASQPPRQTFAELPQRLGAYRCVAETDLSAGERRQLAPSDSLDREYVDQAGQRVRVRLLYWAPRWLAYGDASGPVEGPHEPDCCLSGQGWDRVPGTEEQRTVPWLPGEAVSLRVIRKGDATHAVAFWKKKQDLPPLFHLGSWRKRASLLLASWHSPPTAEVGA
jgi:hypothetical protein